MGRKLDLTGQKFNRLTAIAPTNLRQGSQIVWEWLCDCGKTHYAGGTSVKTGNTKSCGCLNIQRIVERNQAAALPLQAKYGMLTPIENLGLRKRPTGNRRTIYKCKCDCGNIVEVLENSLKSGTTTSCGCLVSKGESKIRACLEEANYNFSTQKSFTDLLSPKQGYLKYDFCIYNDDGTINFLIEFDGRQHRIGPEGNWTGSYTLEELQLYDQIKNEYAIKNGYPLYRIPSNSIGEITLINIIQDKFLVKGE